MIRHVTLSFDVPGNVHVFRLAETLRQAFTKVFIAHGGELMKITFHPDPVGQRLFDEEKVDSPAGRVDMDFTGLAPRSPPA